MSAPAGLHPSAVRSWQQLDRYVADLSPRPDWEAAGLFDLHEIADWALRVSPRAAEVRRWAERGFSERQAAAWAHSPVFAHDARLAARYQAVTGDCRSAEAWARRIAALGDAFTGDACAVVREYIAEGFSALELDHDDRGRAVTPINLHHAIQLGFPPLLAPARYRSLSNPRSREHMARVLLQGVLPDAWNRHGIEHEDAVAWSRALDGRFARSQQPFQAATYKSEGLTPEDLLHTSVTLPIASYWARVMRRTQLPAPVAAEVIACGLGLDNAHEYRSELIAGHWRASRLKTVLSHAG